MNEDLQVRSKGSLLGAPKEYGVTPRELLNLQKMKRKRDESLAIKQAGGNFPNLKNQQEQEKRRKERVEPFVLMSPSQADILLQRDRAMRAVEIQKSGSLLNEQRYVELKNTPNLIDPVTIQVRKEELNQYIEDGLFKNIIVKSKNVFNLFQQKNLVKLEDMYQDRCN